MDAELCRELLIRVAAGDRCALGVVVETRGSTPQQSGAHAIFLRDGQVIGTLGGGCLEMESRRRALDAIDTATARLFELELNEDFGWDDGLICGGTARVFVQPVLPTQTSVLEQEAQLASARMPYVSAVVVNADPPEWIGARWLHAATAAPPQGLPPSLIERLKEPALRALEDETPALINIRGEDVAAEVYLDPHPVTPVLLLAGAGHIGKALGELGAMLGFDVVVIDDRPEFANRERFPVAREVIVDDIESAVARWPMDEHTYTVIVTRGHRNDATALRACIGRPAKYIGMIGSRRKVMLIFRELIEEGYATAEQLHEVHSPLGLDIGAKTIEEIAVSIAAELVAIRRKGSGDQVTAMRIARAVPWEKLDGTSDHAER